MPWRWCLLTSSPSPFSSTSLIRRCVQLLHRLVECFDGEPFRATVLCLHDSLEGSHEYAAFAGQVAEDTLLKGGGEEVPEPMAVQEPMTRSPALPVWSAEDREAGVDAGSGKELRLTADAQ